MRKNKLGVSRCDKELRRDFNAFPVVAITKEGEKYRSKDKSLVLTNTFAVFLFKNFFSEKFGERTSLNIVLLGSDNLYLRFQKYGIKKVNGSNVCCLLSAMKGRRVTSMRFLGSHYEMHFPKVGHLTEFNAVFFFKNISRISRARIKLDDKNLISFKFTQKK